MIVAAATPRATPIPIFAPSDRPLLGEDVDDDAVVVEDGLEDVDTAAADAANDDASVDACGILISVVVVTIVAALAVDAGGELLIDEGCG